MTVRRALVCVAAVMGLAAGAWAQTRPNAGDNRGAYTPSTPPPPLLPQQPAPPAAEPAAPMPLSDFQRSSYPETYASGYPAAEVQAVPGAFVSAVVARAQLRRAESGLNMAVLEIRKAFQRSRDWVSALNEEREAWDALQNARRNALRSLQSDPAYVASVDLKKSLADRIEDIQRQKNRVSEDLMAMAMIKMGYASAASAMEAAAVAADPDVQQAKQRLRSASMKLSELRAQLDHNVRSSREVLEARRNLEDARIAHLATDAYFIAVLNARAVALDYAYYSGRYDQYKYLSYGYYGYNYPYNTYRVGYPMGYPNGYRY